MDVNIINATKASDIFPNDLKKCKEIYKNLVKEWHPDNNKSKNSNDIFNKINALYKQADAMIRDGIWEQEELIKIKKKNGKTLEIRFLYEEDFELGKMYVLNNKIIFVIKKSKEKYYKNAISHINNIQYADYKMENYFKRIIPNIYDNFEMENGDFCLVLNKGENVYPLKLVLKYYNNKISDKHVAWIISRLQNIVCFLQYNGIVHNGITLSNCFICPEDHSIFILGGWWYSAKTNDKIIGIQKQVYDLMPVKNKTDKKASVITDLESIKFLARQLLGEINPRKLSLHTQIPKDFIYFINSGSGDNAVDELVKWDNSLEKSFGKRKFIKMEILNEKIYGKEKEI